jgi:hypothetical protein
VFDPLQYFSWWAFAVVVVVYTIVSFSAFYRQSEPTFSDDNARTPLEIVAIHLGFLLVLFVLMRAAPYVYPHLPEWLTDTFQSRGATWSVADIFFVFLTAILFGIERRYIYVEADEDPPNAK